MSLELSHEATAEDPGLKTPGRKLPLAVKLFKNFSVLADSVLRFGRVRVTVMTNLGNFSSVYIYNSLLLFVDP